MSQEDLEKEKHHVKVIWKIKTMIIGHIYQMSDGSFHIVNMRAALNKYMEQTKIIMEKLDSVVCKWTIKRADRNGH